MKKLLLTSVVMVLASYTFAQGISGGVKAGLNLANQKYSSDGTTADTKVKPGLHAGLFFTRNDQRKVCNSAGSSVFHAGLQIRYRLGFDGNYETNFNYLAVPVLARYNITDRISVHAGPQFAFLLSADT